MKKLGILFPLVASLLAANLALADISEPPTTNSDDDDDSGCSVAGSRLDSSVAPWLIAGAFSVTYFVVRRRRRR